MMKNLIKGLIDQGYNIEFGNDGFYWMNINGTTISCEDWDEAEGVLLDYIINETDL